MNLKTSTTLFKFVTLVKILSILMLWSKSSNCYLSFNVTEVALDNFYSDFWLQQGQIRFFLLDVIRATKSKFNKKLCILNFNYIVIVLSIIILLCGDVELNPGFTIDSDKIGLVLNERNMEIVSTSTGILKQSISTRDERYMRSFFQWQGDGDCFLDGTQNNGNNCF